MSEGGRRCVRESARMSSLVAASRQLCPYMAVHATFARLTCSGESGTRQQPPYARESLLAPTFSRSSVIVAVPQITIHGREAYRAIKFSRLAVDVSYFF